MKLKNASEGGQTERIEERAFKVQKKLTSNYGTCAPSFAFAQESLAVGSERESKMKVNGRRGAARADATLVRVRKL